MFRDGNVSNEKMLLLSDAFLSKSSDRLLKASVALLLILKIIIYHTSSPRQLVIIGSILQSYVFKGVE